MLDQLFALEIHSELASVGADAPSCIVAVAVCPIPKGITGIVNADFALLSVSPRSDECSFEWDATRRCFQFTGLECEFTRDAHVTPLKPIKVYSENVANPRGPSKFHLVKEYFPIWFRDAIKVGSMNYRHAVHWFD